MGLSTAVELGIRGKSVLLLEQFEVPNKLGSSHGETRVIRTAYFEHPDYVPLAQRAWRRWEELGGALGSPVLLQTGGLYLGRPGSALISGSIKAAEKHSLEYELVSAGQIRNRYPQLRVPESYVGFLEAQCGVLLASEAIGWMLYQALATRVDVRSFQRVKSWQASGNRVTVTSNSEAFEASKLVICAGPWTGKVLSDLNIPLSVTRQIVGFTAPADAKLFSASSMPVTCIESSSGKFYYTIPICPFDDVSNRLFKSATHDHGDKVTPETVDRATNAADKQSFLSELQDFLPEAAENVQKMEVCLYTNTPDGHFVVDRHPEHDNVVFACGFSGHGFKFAPVIGEALADLALNGKTDLPIAFWSAKRFQP